MPQTLDFTGFLGFFPSAIYKIINSFSSCQSTDYFGNCSLPSQIYLFYYRIPEMTTLKIQASLQPDNSLESSTNFRDSHQIFLVHSDVEDQVVAVDCHLIQLLAGQFVRGFHPFKNLSHYIIPVALHAIRHKIRIYNRKNIFVSDSS